MCFVFFPQTLEPWCFIQVLLGKSHHCLLCLDFLEFHYLQNFPRGHIESQTWFQLVIEVWLHCLYGLSLAMVPKGLVRKWKKWKVKAQFDTILAKSSKFISRGFEFLILFTRFCQNSVELDQFNIVLAKSMKFISKDFENPYSFTRFCQNSVELDLLLS